ncbi:DNA primase [Flavobacterium soyangense]|uniref:DNA primase n=1 Tax=Flavobacterium soyangense TaxID=2023265 RepID=A0A930UD13_9FLAO|nr:DNA primase [Flavobacterium soyangense]MBF2708582.1 DNA primase [Flavobacterium soyangense]
MKRVIVDYAKLTHEILNLLVDKFPDGYDDSNIIRFRNAQNELIEAVEVKTEDTIFLVKISTNLADRIENYDEDDEIAAEIEPLEEGLDLDEEDDDIDDGDSLDKPDFKDEDDSDDDDDDDDEKDVADEDDEDED